MHWNSFYQPLQLHGADWHWNFVPDLPKCAMANAFRSLNTNALRCVHCVHDLEEKTERGEWTARGCVMICRGVLHIDWFSMIAKSKRWGFQWPVFFDIFAWMSCFSIAVLAICQALWHELTWWVWFSIRDAISKTMELISSIDGWCAHGQL